jgi:hypothetical protein
MASGYVDARAPAAATTDATITVAGGDLRGPVRRMLLGGYRLGRWPILAWAPPWGWPELEKDDPQEPRPVDGGRTRLFPADWAPGGHQCPEELPRPSRVSLESLVLRPEGRLNLTTTRRVAPPTAQRFAVRTRRPFWQELQPGFPGPTASAPRGNCID